MSPSNSIPLGQAQEVHAGFGKEVGGAGDFVGEVVDVGVDSGVGAILGGFVGTGVGSGVVGAGVVG